MAVKRIIAADMRSALQAISDQFGPDAAVISNKCVDEGIELLFSVSDDEQGQLDPVLDPVSAAADTQRSTLEKGIIMQKQEMRQKAKFIEQQLKRKKGALSAAEVYELRDLDEKPGNKMDDRLEAEYPASTPLSTAGSKPALQKAEANDASSKLELESLRHELAQMRSVFQSQLESMRWPQFQQQQPQMAEFWRRLTAMGIEPDVIRTCLDTLSRQRKNTASALEWSDVMRFFTRRLMVDASDPVMQGGVHVFVGPTGVGKTTTIAKLAAQYVLMKGVDSISLITTDCFRIAGHEQLRVISRLLNIPLIVSKPEELAGHIERLKHQQLILVDTAGVNPNDEQQLEQLRQVALLGQTVQTWLLLNATSQYRVLKRHNDLYQQAKPDAYMLTKTDESSSLGESLSCLLQQAKPLAYTTFGQQIPGDMACADAASLMQQCADNAEQGVSGEILSMAFSRSMDLESFEGVADSHIA